MARKPAAPPTAGGAESGVCERCGPLAIERLAKADGRALIIYSRARAESPERHARREECERG